ncbi:FAD-dependent thymidylate synthase [Streptomyces sp. NPDC102364]|uniref:FAD-dependent thymidylate synthase n=1 Tax=Streptomyces sp. NPDC102364 TaxID=3366161 RepID=UPI0037F1C624
MTEFKLRRDVGVRLVKSNASDADVVQAARVSTQGVDSLGEVGKPAGLINYLMRDRHGSPFEHTSFTFLVEAPLFVAREHMRHRAGWSYNEESGRYKELEGSFYAPGKDRPLIQVGKPGAYVFEQGTSEQSRDTREGLELSYRASWFYYQRLLEDGIAREVARMVLPVGLFTSYYATCNARSLMHFLSLRTISEGSLFPSFPQREIEMVAEQMEAALEKSMPLTYAAFGRHGRVAP